MGLAVLVLLAPVLLAVCSAQDSEVPPEPEAPEDPLAPGPLRAIAHVKGFLTRSVLAIDALPDRPFELRVLYLFPDRSRWTIQPVEGRAVERADTYRFGGHAWRHSAREGRSVELEGAARDAQLLRMELRRAVFLWPDGFDWKEVEAPAPEAGPSRSAEVFCPAPEKPRRVGALRATLDAEGRPLEVTVEGPEGTKRRTLRVLGWQTKGKRSWPRELELVENGTRTWKETVNSVETQVTFLDRYFVPLDRRPDDPELALEARILAQDLREMVVRTHDLPEETTWEQATARFEALRAAAADELGERGLAPSGVPAFGLDAAGRPRTVLLTLADPLPETVPPGWTALARRPGRILVVKTLTLVGAAALARLRTGLPPGLRAGEPYVRLWGEDRIQITLPLDG